MIVAREEMIFWTINCLAINGYPHDLHIPPVSYGDHGGAVG